MIVSYNFNTHVDLYFVKCKKKEIVIKFRSGHNVFATALSFAVFRVGAILFLLTASDTSVVAVVFTGKKVK